MRKWTVNSKHETEWNLYIHYYTKNTDLNKMSPSYSGVSPVTVHLFCQILSFTHECFPDFRYKTISCTILTLSQPQILHCGCSFFLRKVSDRPCWPGMFILRLLLHMRMHKKSEFKQEVMWPPTGKWEIFYQGYRTWHSKGRQWVNETFRCNPRQWVNEHLDTMYRE